jgi:plasmid stabilization system protein ParE
MAGQLDVFWSSKSIRDFENIIRYLERNWTEKEIKNFNFKLNKAINLISSRPKLFQATNSRKNLRKCVLTKQTTLYYQVLETGIYIVALFDNRQNPVKRP